MRVLQFLVELSIASALRYINEKKIESLGMSGPSVNKTADGSSKYDLLDIGHFILVKSQNCAEACDAYEKSLDTISEDLTEKVSASLGDKTVKWYKTEIAQTGIKSFKKKFGLMKLPTTILLRGPWVYEYTDDLTQAKLHPYLLDHLSEIVTPLGDDDDVEDFLKHHSTTSGSTTTHDSNTTTSSDTTTSSTTTTHSSLYPDDVRMIIETGEAGRQNFELIAGGEREFSKYGSITRGDETETHGSIRVVKWAKDFVIKDLDFNDHKKIFEIIISNQLPSLGEINLSKMRYYFYGHKAFAWIIYSEEEEQKGLPWLKFAQKSFRPSVKKYGDQFNFLRINPQKNPDFQDFLKEVLKIDPKTDRALVITDLNGPGRFTYRGKSGGGDTTTTTTTTNPKPKTPTTTPAGWSSSEIRKWIKAVLEDKIDRELQSEPIPSDEKERLSEEFGLRKIVADELAEVLIGSSKNQILIAPSMLCPEELCEAALNAHKELSKDEEFLQKNSLSINLINGNKNEFDPKWKFDLTSDLPPVWFFKANQTVEALEHLVKEQIPKSALANQASLKEWIEIKVAGGSSSIKSEL